LSGWVPAGFAAPRALNAERFRLVPLGPEHNASDHEAWSSSIAHIRSTPGFETHSWPPLEGMSLAANLGDLERHAREFVAGERFSYTVLAPDRDEVIGCVYIDPARDGNHDAEVRSWVRASAAELDVVLHDAVAEWLASAWPLVRVRYAPRRRG
jgi:hypothetical protein